MKSLGFQEFFWGGKLLGVSQGDQDSEMQREEENTIKFLIFPEAQFYLDVLIAFFCIFLNLKERVRGKWSFFFCKI